MEDYLVPDEDWCHFDFIIARDVGRVINSRILRVLEASEDSRSSSSTSDDFSIINPDSCTPSPPVPENI